MKYLVNSREMKLYDKNTSEQFKIPSIVLMERAAEAFVAALRRRNTDCSKALIVCGVGNNGGDGLAIARLLALAGSQVTVILHGDRRKATESNRRQQEILAAYGIPITDKIPEQESYSLVVDALFGVGLSRSIEGETAALVEQLNRLSGFKAAADIASGISADNGAILGTAFCADLTVTFAYGKLGMYLFPGSEYSGEIEICDIGINERSWLERRPAVAALEYRDIAGLLPQRPLRSNKGTFGKLLILAGSVGMAGAAVLCGKAAYASGCGLVRIVTPEENRSILQTALPEAILTTYGKRLENTVLSEAMKWADVILCGPGIGTAETAENMVKQVMKNAAVPVLFDADALNIIARDVNLLLAPHTEFVITPHLGEMSRLTGDSVSYIQTELVAEAEEFARQYNVVCVLKDARTVTSVPYRQTWLNLSGNNGMATAGSGDVLSGIIGGLMAQGLNGEEAAPLGVYLHGLAGDLMRKQTGIFGLMASDLITGIRCVFAGLEEK
ncbi:MAG: NAD(P)H-hydrate dehydratase [Roseburia sp.]